MESPLFPTLGRDRGPAPLRSPSAGQARIYAQLLVSEIRLYHEEDVLQGRAVGDLAHRLQEPIAAARALFQRRFDDPKIFDGELVRILAGGDSHRMG